MSCKFYAVHRESGKRWKPDPAVKGKQYLMMYDTGYLAVVTEDFYTFISPLSIKEWEVQLAALREPLSDMDISKAI